MTKLDDSKASGYLTYDPDTRIVFIWGKGDAQIQVFEYVPGSPNFIEYVHTFQQKDSFKGFDLRTEQKLSTKELTCVVTTCLVQLLGQKHALLLCLAFISSSKHLEREP